MPLNRFLQNIHLYKPVTKKDKYWEIVKHYESCLDQHGDTHLGVDWPKKEDADTRYKVMLEVIRNDGPSISLLDFGCGASHLHEYILRNDLRHIRYAGLDISHKFIELSKSKFPKNDYYCVDILQDATFVKTFDYIIMNGVFTEKRGLSFEDMIAYFKKMIVRVFNNCKRGIAFNVMSKHVDWEREDLFHLSHDILAEFLTKRVTRNYIIRNDYGLYEYTVYAYKTKYR